MKRATSVALVALVTLACALACPGVTRPLEHPQVRVLEVAATSDGDGATLLVRVQLEVRNPNPTQLVARALDWRLASDASGPVLHGRTSLEATVPGKDAEILVAVLRIAPEAAAPMLARMGSGDRAFHLAGTVHLFSERGDLGAIFDQQGRLAPW